MIGQLNLVNDEQYADISLPEILRLIYGCNSIISHQSTSLVVQDNVLSVDLTGKIEKWGVGYIYQIIL